MEFRQATPEDAARLAELGSRSFVETFGHLYQPEDLSAFLHNHAPDRWAAELSDPQFSICLVEDEGQTAAYAKLGPPSLPFEPRGKPIELRQFYVLAPWQGNGTAHRLMDWVLNEARERGADELYLSVFTENHRARKFYQRYGFEEVGPYKFMVGNQADDDIVMRLPL